MNDAVLIYPRLGSMDSMVADLPLSVLYAASEAVKRGYEIKALDLRLVDGDWRPALRRYLDQGVRLLGVSVMTGSPLSCAREVSRFVKDNYPETKVVWGGPHGTVVPETIEHTFLDYLVRGYGSLALADLIAHLREGKPALSEIAGLSYRENGRIIHNPRPSSHETTSYKDIPYQLVPVNHPAYTRSYQGARMFPIFTAIGCPYHCSFCVHPRVYRVINGKKWQPYPDEEIVEHMEMLIRDYGANHICFIDDTSFPDLERMRRLFNLILERGIKVELEFRGARINEIDRMDDEFLDLMARVGGRVLMVGVESASDRILKRMQKGISKEQILRANRKLARHPQLRPHYNFIYGCPGETYEDLKETARVMLQIIKENPQAYIGFGSDWKPIPGTLMLDIAEKEYGYQAPKTLDQWIEMDSSDSKHKIVHPWYTSRHNNLIKLLQVASFVIDDKLIKESQSNRTAVFRLIRMGSRIYKPVALFRMRHGMVNLMAEYELWRLAVRAMGIWGARRRKSTMEKRD